MTLLQVEPDVAMRPSIEPAPATDTPPAIDALPAAAQVPPTTVPAPLTRLRAVLLLAGTVRHTPFIAGIGRSVLDLPWDGERTILDVWRDDIADFARQIRWERPRVHVLIDQRCAAPTVRSTGGNAAAAEIVVRRDRSELRGVGGLLYDVAEAYDDDDYLLVAHAAQILREPLALSAVEVASQGGDVGLLAHRDGSAVSLWLVRCASVRRLSPVGYVDFIEQGLPRIADTHRVTVSFRDESTGLPLRTERDYLAALRWHYRRLRLGAVARDPFAEDWQPMFRLVETGAELAPGADVFDSVVLGGARIERGAMVVRSVLCPGAVVRRGRRVVDQLVGGRAAAFFVSSCAPAQGRTQRARPAMLLRPKLGTSGLTMP
jgi:hypothetical protein